MRTVLIGVVLAVAGCGGGVTGSDAGIDAALPDAAQPDAAQPDAACPPERVVTPTYTELTVKGDTGDTQGIIDPSIDYPAGSSFGVMTYTAVPSAAEVHTRIATSVDHGATWTYASDVNIVTAASVTTSDMSLCGAATCTGSWVQESSSVVVDPGEPDPSKRVKVWAHSYFWNGKVHFQIGTINLYTAATPDGPWTATRFFGWRASPPGAVQDIKTDPRLAGLAGCFLLAEPGALVRQVGASTVIDLALACARLDLAKMSASIEIDLLRSTDHGASFSFVSTMLSADDATLLGSANQQINGGDLFVSAGKEYLFASPSGPVDGFVGTFNGYRGCLAFEVVDPDSGAVARCGGVPVVSAAYLGMDKQFVGACSEAEGASAMGATVPLPDISTATPRFVVYTTGSTP